MKSNSRLPSLKLELTHVSHTANTLHWAASDNVHLKGKAYFSSQKF